MVQIIIGIIVGLVVGGAAVYFYATSKTNESVLEANKKLDAARMEANRITTEAKNAAETARKTAILEAKEEILQLRQESETEDKRRKGELQRMENRILQREESLDKRNEALDKRESQISSMQSSVDRRRNEIDGLYAAQEAELERISALTREDAHKEIIDRVRAETVRDEAQILRESEQRIPAQADKTAREIVSTAIQRCAADQAGEITVTSVHIPSDDLKGRIIGREGRNIRTFEQVTGVTLVIDDTPETVILSSFNPVRRETARVALENLIADGRIHPARIEEMYRKAERLVNERIQEAGEQAAFDAGKRRMVPIFLTTATTAVGVVPMIIAQSSFWMPVGVTIFAGGIGSLIMVVTMLPVIYWKVNLK
jgi:ribonuclease Y